MTFKVIESQEEFDRMVSERLNREREKFSDYEDLKKQVDTLTNENSSLQSTIKTNGEKYADYDKNIDELNGRIKEYETATLRTKVALSNGLPFDLADRLVGDDEESLAKDAERLSGLMKPNDPVPPLKDPEPNTGSNENTAYSNMLNNLNLGE